MKRWFDRLRARLHRPAPAIGDGLWQHALHEFPFLPRSHSAQSLELRSLAQQFLADKEFHGAAGLAITDTMAVAIAAQACLPVLGIAAPRRGLDWYGDFVGIVVYPGTVRARRETVDDNGVVHQYHEEIRGEAMHQGPVMLSWQDVAGAGQSAADGYNVVIHEFVHKIDLCDGEADGCPPLPAGFMGAGSAAAARDLWQDTLHSAYRDFSDRLSLAERFGGAPVWLDAYGATSPGEFFAVSSEAYFVNRPRFHAEFAQLTPLFDAFFHPARNQGVSPLAASAGPKPED